MSDTPDDRSLVASLVLTLIVSALAVEPDRTYAEERLFTPEKLATYSARYLSGHHQPSPQDTVFWAIAYPVGGGTRYLTVNSDSGMVVLIFTSPFRLINYTQHHTISTPFRIVGWSATTCLDRLQEIRQTGTRLHAVDSSPSCPGSGTVATNDATTASSLLAEWYASRVASNTVGLKHYTAALTAIDSGDFHSSVETLIALVSCVVPEEPRIWLLLGASGIALAKDDLVEVAVDALLILDPQLGERLSKEAARASSRSEEDRVLIAGGVAKRITDARSKVLEP